MKNSLLILSLSFAFCASAQLEGEIKYTTKINLHAELGEGENVEMIKQMMPEFQEVKQVLLFTASESLYDIEKDEEETGGELLEQEGNVQIKIEMGSKEEKIYTNIKEGIVVQQRDLMGKTFLITDTLQQSDWHVTNAQKEVHGMVCQKAFLENEGDTIVAWFTSQIPVSTGPEGFGGLPGLIVHISMDGGNFQITANQIISREIGGKEIKAPEKGKEITQEKFDALQKKKVKEMQEQYEGMSGDGNVIMITN